MSTAAERARRTPREREIAKIMRRFKKRKLHSGQGPNKEKPPKGKIVMNREQAIAIALSVAKRKYGPYIRKDGRG
jgi:hypothetical protein